MTDGLLYGPSKDGLRFTIQVEAEGNRITVGLPEYGARVLAAAIDSWLAGLDAENNESPGAGA